MKSFKAGTECTLKKPLFCPDNGETPRVVPILCRHFNPFDLRRLKNSKLFCQGFINHFASKNWNLGNNWRVSYSIGFVN